MTSWKETYSEILDVINDLNDEGCPDPFFRGHANSSWQLLPSLARRTTDPITENRLYYNFTSLGGHLFPQSATTWDTLFMMQHYGLPTRLLDWSESFGVALYFALKNCMSEGAVWVLNPYALNSESLSIEETIYLNTDFPIGYFKYFIDDRNDSYGSFPAPVMAIGGGSSESRMRSQRGVFTLHRELRKPLEEVYPQMVKKIIISQEAIAEAKQFLLLAGINEYSLFPDLDGLSRYLIEREFNYE